MQARLKMTSFHGCLEYSMLDGRTSCTSDVQNPVKYLGNYLWTPVMNLHKFKISFLNTWVNYLLTHARFRLVKAMSKSLGGPGIPWVWRDEP